MLFTVLSPPLQPLKSTDRVFAGDVVFCFEGKKRSQFKTLEGSTEKKVCSGSPEKRSSNAIQQIQTSRSCVSFIEADVLAFVADLLSFHPLIVFIAFVSVPSSSVSAQAYILSPFVLSPIAFVSVRFVADRFCLCHHSFCPLA